ncbi:MAG: DMT family transporter [Candidatus Magasanikbacteria bacterium]
MSIGIIFGLGALICWGLESALAPTVIKKIGAIPTIFWRYLWEIIIFVPIFLYFLPTFNFNPLYLIFTIAIAFVGYIPVITFYRALKVGKIGVIAPVAHSSIVITVVLSILFFQETLQPLQVGAIVLIILGVLIMSINFSDFKSSEIFNKSSGLGEALITCLLWGIVYVLFKIPINILGPILTAIVLETATGFYALITLKLQHQNLKFAGDKKLLGITFLMGLFGAVAITLCNYGVQNHNVSLVVPVAMASPLVAMIYGRLVYKELLTKQQIIAGLLIIAGIVLISL